MPRRDGLAVPRDVDLAGDAMLRYVAAALRVDGEVALDPVDFDFAGADRSYADVAGDVAKLGFARAHRGNASTPAPASRREGPRAHGAYIDRTGVVGLHLTGAHGGVEGSLDVARLELAGPHRAVKRGQTACLRLARADIDQHSDGRRHSRLDLQVVRAAAETPRVVSIVRQFNHHGVTLAPLRHR